MNAEVKEKWVAALRSGEYQQGTGYLVRPAVTEDGGYDPAAKRYCCLGVLCDLFTRENDESKGKWVDRHRDGYARFEYPVGVEVQDEQSTLPTPVQVWAGLDDDDPNVTFEGRLQTLAAINDNHIPFPVIANLITEQL